VRTGCFVREVFDESVERMRASPPTRWRLSQRKALWVVSEACVTRAFRERLWSAAERKLLPVLASRRAWVEVAGRVGSLSAAPADDRERQIRCMLGQALPVARRRGSAAGTRVQRRAVSAR
jgi:hypothetical protein